MTTGEQLFAQILEQPASDANRLIFADWLEDNGGADRAELIRVQCALAAMGPKPSHALCQGDPRCEACKWEREGGGTLAHREYQLLQAHGEHWLLFELIHPAAIEVGGEKRWLTYNSIVDIRVPRMGSRGTPLHWLFHWKRGFVEGVYCSWQEWERHADAIRAAVPLAEVGLSSMPTGISFEKPYTESQKKVLEAGVLKFLADRYPGIQFELPREPAPLRRDASFEVRNYSSRYENIDADEFHRRLRRAVQNINFPRVSEPRSFIIGTS